MTKAQLDRFYEFASSQLDNGGAETSIDELYALWKSKEPTDVELDESVAAIKAAFADWQAGDAGLPARTALRESCKRLGLAIDE